MEASLPVPPAHVHAHARTTGGPEDEGCILGRKLLSDFPKGDEKGGLFTGANVPLASLARSHQLSGFQVSLLIRVFNRDVPLPSIGARFPIEVAFLTRFPA